MPVSRQKVGLLIAFVALALIVSVQLASGKKKDQQTSPTNPMEEQKRAVHALNRLTFGPRPGDVQRVISIGVDQWIEQQLHPEKIDDRALDARLAPFRTLRMDDREMMQNYPSPEMVKAVMNGRQPLPSDPVKRAIYEDEIARMQQKQERKQEARANAAENNSNGSPDNAALVTRKAKLTDDEMAQRREDRLYADLKAQELLSLSPDQRMKEILRMSPDQRRMLAATLKGPKAEEFMEGMSPQQKETLIALNNPQQVIVNELTQAKLLRAIYSERQLDEVMTDFWFNHFNVFVGKGPDRYLITSYERDVIRPRAFGKFEDLLVATAKSPAMLVYLDNFLSVGPDSDVALGIPKNPHRPARRRGFGGGFPRRPQAQNAKARRSGLNENYGRELMELHTLGVNGGYTQNDVTEVARVFTGWTVEKPQEGGGFKFDPRMHEPGTKIVLGHKIKKNGEKEGREVLHLLAHHPSTAKFISTKLAMRFVSDNPPPALVNRMVQTFLKKDGDIREVLRTMFRSPEFWSPDAYRAKVKTPLEFVVSSVRATGAEVTDAQPLIRELNQLGMPLYAMQPPTGYSMKAESWVNSSALLSRMNFALALGADKLKGVQPNVAGLFAPQAPPADSHQSLAVLENALLAGDVSQQTHGIISQQLDQPTPIRRPADSPSPNINIITGLILGSPEFQRR
ncbi:MAG TPA: DUF1800 domain-containing protein [Terriglobales bacterium]|nr:DUF1800 domain-containing protein [Terriglobales bacterium]